MVLEIYYSISRLQSTLRDFPRSLAFDSSHEDVNTSRQAKHVPYAFSRTESEDRVPSKQKVMIRNCERRREKIVMRHGERFKIFVMYIALVNRKLSQIKLELERITLAISKFVYFNYRIAYLKWAL